MTVSVVQGIALLFGAAGVVLLVELVRHASRAAAALERQARERRE